ncbi:MAG: fumarylacetoacetate hydrolase family protein [Phycisphaerae bacterium]|nr:fumarylacetoacetate hydrolase family protein [Phycisphaerae bacterium]
MKLARFRAADGVIGHGVVRESELCEIAGDVLGDRRETGRRIPLRSVRLLAPIVPSNILCFGKNYRAHAEEGGSDVPKAPLMFMKATSCVIAPGEPIVIPRVAPAQVDYEAELAVVIGKPARHVSEADALDFVLGYTCANDVSARDCQASDGQWSRAKSFDTFCPLGPWIETDADPANLHVQGRLNDKVMQDANTSLMIFSVRHLVSYLSRGMTLLPGTVLLTGTPAGCAFAQTPPAWLTPGDVYEVRIDGVGTLRNPLIQEAAS